MLNMDKDARVIRSMKNPPMPVKDTMLAMLVLLGYLRPIRQGEDWGLVQRVVGKGGKDAISRKAAAFNVNRVTPQEAQYARAHIKNYNIHDVKNACFAAAVFYHWVQSALTNCPADPLPDTCK